MSTYGAMQDRIADEIARSDLASQIRNSIQTAIEYYERRRFYWNEAQTTFTTVADQEYYGSADNSEIPLILMIDALRLTVNNSTYTLVPRDFWWMETIQTNNSYTGDPTDYAYYNQQIRLYPIPDGAMTVQMSYVKRFDDLSATADTNAWMVEGEELIRTRAKRDLFTHVIRSPEEAMLMAQAEREAFNAVQENSVNLISTGRLRPTNF